MNLEENRELGVVRLHNFNSRFPIHGKFLVPKNVNWEVVLYIERNILLLDIHIKTFNKIKSIIFAPLKKTGLFA